MKNQKWTSQVLGIYLFFCLFSVLISNSSATTNEEIEFTKLCEISTSGRTDYIEFVDNFCFVFDFEKGFMSYNIENPEEPELLDTLTFSNNIDPRVRGGHDFIIIDNVAIVDYMHAGIKFVNISNPSELVVIDGYYSEGNEYYRIDKIGNRIYCAKAEGGLEIFEYDQDFSIKSIGSFSNGNIMSHIECFQEDLVYIADYGRGSTLLLNVSDPMDIIELKAFDWMAGNILFKDNFMFVSVIRPDDEGLRIYDNIDPLNPVLLGELTGFEASSAIIKDDYLFLVGTRGLQIINFTDSIAPFEISNYSEGGLHYLHFAIKGNLFGIVDFDDNWYLIEVDGLNLSGINNENNGNKYIPGYFHSSFLINTVIIIAILIISNRKIRR